VITWLTQNWGFVLNALGQHVYLALVPVVVGFALSVPLGWLAMRFGALRSFIFYVFGFIYSIPSIALIVIVPVLFGLQILSPLNVIIPLTVYTIALMVRSVVDALTSVPGEVRAAATAMGYRPLRLFWSVDLPLSIPVMISGLRVAAVSSISLVSVGTLVGIGGLGILFDQGFHTNFIGEIVIGVIFSVLLALVVDVVLVLIGRFSTPWTRAGR
jgi:osmoprotectant transport system permease protein